MNRREVIRKTAEEVVVCVGHGKTQTFTPEEWAKQEDIRDRASEMFSLTEREGSDE